MRENLSEQVVVRLTPTQRAHIENEMRELRNTTGLDRLTVSDVIRMKIAAEMKREAKSGKA